MHFKKLEWADTKTLISFSKLLTGRECDPTPGCTLMWREYCGIFWHSDGESLYICLHDDAATPHYALPVSLNHKNAISKLVNENKGDGPMFFTTIPEAHVDTFRQLFPDCIVTEQRDFADYLYSAEKLVTMAGRKLSGQRNQMSQFRRNHPDWSFHPITQDNLPAVKAFLQEEFIDNPDNSENKKTEDRMALDMIEHLDTFPLLGGVLLAEGRVLGLSFGEAIGDTLYVHIEKANRNEKGSYQMVVNQFSAMYAVDDVVWINREDDSGDPGLRRAKEAYLPDTLLKK